jgi:short subunit dehydrogenase-like uncharacterized protein
MLLLAAIMGPRDFDVVLYGASGFVGRQLAVRLLDEAPACGLRWALAGRDRARLQAVGARLGRAAADIPLLVADGRDRAAVERMVARTAVVANTAGPFALCADAIVDACVEQATDYVDITGETPWVAGLIARHHEPAAARGVRIVPCCGFDSVPSDLGTWLLVRRLRERYGVGCRSVTAAFALRGEFNGGTIASALAMQESPAAARLADPFLLDPPQAHHGPEQIAANRDPRTPHYDSEIGAWLAPFFMGPINTRVVRRSAALHARWGAAYGESFRYQEYLRHDGPLAPLAAHAVAAATWLARAALVRPAWRSALRPLLPPPGSGPSEAEMDRGWFRCELHGTGEDGRRLRLDISERGDPGNRATVKYLCQAALALACERERLPGGAARGGVLTPAAAFGDVLAQRLLQRGTEIAFG